MLTNNITYKPHANQMIPFIRVWIQTLIYDLVYISINSNPAKGLQ